MKAHDVVLLNAENVLQFLDGRCRPAVHAEIKSCVIEANRRQIAGRLLPVGLAIDVLRLFQVIALTWARRLPMLVPDGRGGSYG